MAIDLDPDTERRIVEGAKAADVSINDYLIYTLKIDMPFYGEVPATWRTEQEERKAARRLVTRKPEDRTLDTAPDRER